MNMEEGLGAADAAPAGYPMSAYLNFFPGGMLSSSENKEADFYDLASYSQVPAEKAPGHSQSPRSRSGKAPDFLVHKAKIADDRLHQYALLSSGHNPETPHFLPSLSILANSAFGRLTGVPPNSVKSWADAMVLQYSDEVNGHQPRATSEDQILRMEPAAMKVTKESAVNALKRLLQESQSSQDSASMVCTPYKPRPCGYVFKRGDIAWNCRTCQTDSTCVICDTCFRNSNHEGHEVYFHRTTPGGCCDCGDPEAWKIEGCCEQHRPQTNTSFESSTDDPEEAVRMAAEGKKDGIDILRNAPTNLPPRLAAALGVVIGAAVNCLIEAVDGAGIGADPVQWKMKWADEASKLQNSSVNPEDYIRSTEANTTPAAFLQGDIPVAFPPNYQLQLRLHNDDVHTFDEVIDALNEPRNRRNAAAIDPQHQSLVPQREAANDMTHHVDADGQVKVKTFSSIVDAMQGFRRLKSRGLHCAVVSSPQVDMELRAKALCTWLTEISSAHPAAAVLVVQALVQVESGQSIAGITTWSTPRTIPSWIGVEEKDPVQQCRKRFSLFPPHLASSYLTSEEAEKLHGIARTLNSSKFVSLSGTSLDFYANVPYYLQSARYRKSPHALWGTLPSTYSDQLSATAKHPFLQNLAGAGQGGATGTNRLTETVFVVDTDLRKQQEADRITSSVFPHRLPGLHLISGTGMARIADLEKPQPLPNPMEYRHLLATSSFRAPLSPILLLLLLDPYPTKQLRGAIHGLFLSLLTDARFKCRFAAALAIAYRPLSTLFCAGVGTEADTPLGFTVQIFTAGSLVRALGSASATEKLLLPDNGEVAEGGSDASIGVFTIPIALTVVRCIHTNLLGATKEVHMILNNTGSGNDDNSEDEAIQSTNDSLLPALTYVAGEHPLLTPLPAAPDDGFLDSRSTRHKRLPHLLRDLEYVIETPGTAIRLLLPHHFPSSEGAPLSSRGEEPLPFATVWARLLRLAQGMDPQKRKISGGHVEYEQNRWLEAFGLSLNFAGTRDALAESPTNSSSAALAPVSADGSHLTSINDAMGSVIAAVLREMKHWLYREEMLETLLPMPPSGAHGASDHSQIEALQRSTLHVSASQLSAPSESQSMTTSNVSTIALSCATTVKMTEAQLDLIESTLRVEGAQRQYKVGMLSDNLKHNSAIGAIMGDWLRVPHSPLAGDSLSFHLPLHRALAKTVKSFCAVVVPEATRNKNSKGWWKLPVLDEMEMGVIDQNSSLPYHPLVPLIRPILRSSNCRIVWSAGPDCSSEEAQQRRTRSRAVSANIAVAKIIHSLADHPIRCLAAAQQIERHLWARNGGSTAGMALNYSNAPLCRSFRDLDLTLVQLSASGMSTGLGARRVFALLISRFSMDGYLCDPERRSTTGSWVNPPRLQDPDHAVVLSESFFSTLCVLATELPYPPPLSSSDETWLRQSIRRELIHALAAEPRSHSAAISAASCAVGRRDDSDGSAGTSGGGGLFRDVFAQVLKDVGKKKSQGSRAKAGPASFELNPSCCDEYDPTFFHLRRSEHQHAMDTVSTLRKQKLTNENGKSAADSYCFPVVCQPPKAHPRFLTCRLMLHLSPMDAAIRRCLLFAVFAGSWLPPPEPTPKNEADEDTQMSNDSEQNGVSITRSSNGEIPVLTFSSRRGQPLNHSPSRRGSSFSENDSSPPFSPEVLASSSVSFLEVLQLLTLQVHTLEECASLHRLQPDLDEESKALSSSLSINSYLGRLINVPDSLVDVWALRPSPRGPLSSAGSGENRASILGLLIALYEHRADHGAGGAGGNGQDQGDDHGGARSLAASGLKWLLRFVHSLIEGAPSVASAIKSATTGVPIQSDTATTSTGDAKKTAWTIDDGVLRSAKGMLSNLADLWPKASDESKEKTATNDTKSKERGKAAQQRMLAMMKRKQNAFVASMGPSEAQEGKKSKGEEKEEELCIICRCGDADGENNGPLGFLGHVQRSRVAQLRACGECVEQANERDEISSLYRKYRVVGHMGCQVRETEAMDSAPVSCLPRGSIVSVLKSTVSQDYDILSRRILLRHVASETGKVTEGWASVQSSQGYVILSPLSSLCYENTKWGNTRPLIRQCGHAAHLRCVELHTLSLHQRAAGEQPYDGRFAANIDDGEFLCPLCKQLSNILIPRDGCARDNASSETSSKPEISTTKVGGEARSMTQLILDGMTVRNVGRSAPNKMGKKALEDFGSHLLQGMGVSWERTTGARKRKQRHWHPSIQRWDYEEEEDELSDKESAIGNILRSLRQQHIAWAAIGHSAAAAEASVRGLEDVLPFGTFSKTEDPWPNYTKSKGSDPMLLELTRTLTGVSGLLEVLLMTLAETAGKGMADLKGSISIIGICLVNILEGRGWYSGISPAHNANEGDEVVLWSQLNALMASMPCHVSRDGMISQRHEARAAAAAMWTVTGVGNESRTPAEPPVPLSVSKMMLTSAGRAPQITRDWGTTIPFEDPNGSVPLYRPGIASSFLYTPLLAWDMNSLAGAVFSSILLSTEGDIPSCTDVLNAGRLLLTGRVIQVIVTPHGFDAPSEMDVDEEDEEGRWAQDELQSEASAIMKLVSHCKIRIEKNSSEDPSELLEGKGDNYSAVSLFGSISRAILPFARSLILMMRACENVIESRKERAGTSNTDVSPEAKTLESLLDGSETMCTNDGLFILKEMQGPMPSILIDTTSDWFGLINRWVSAVIVHENHHGSRGKSYLSSLSEASEETKTPPTHAKNDSSAVISHGVRSHQHGLSSDDEDAMIDEEQMQNNAGFLELGESDEELIEDMEMDEAEEIVDFINPGMLDQGLLGDVRSSGSQDMEDFADEPSSSGSEDGDGLDASSIFAGVSQSPLISYQPSLLGVQPIGPGRQGSMFEADKASVVMSDLSHLGLIHRKDSPTFSLIRLPKSFVELYGIVNKVKGRDEATLEDTEDVGNAETAICLLTGAVMRSGSTRRPYQRAQRPPGACTIHARKTGSGIGIFFLVQKCTVLLMHNNKSAYSASLYVDEYGEEDPGLRRGRPLFLNAARYRALELLWRQQGIPREVAQIRSTSDRVIRDNWY